MTSDEITNASSGQIADILTEYNNWRRGKPPYDEPCSLNLSAYELGLCLDRAIEILRGESLNTKSPENENSEKVVYNGGKTREALEFAVRQLTMAIVDDETGGNLLYLAGCMRVVANKCRAALAEPPRNCDIGTASDMAQRFKQFCHEHCSLDKCCDECPLKLRRAPCEFEWARMPYTEGGVE